MAAGPSSDDERRFANNPFARALTPEPDDERARSPILYVAFGLLSLLLAAVFVAALVLPPMLMHTLIIRGARTGRPGMLILGLLLAAFYLAMLYGAARRLMGRAAPPPPDA